MRLKIFLSIVLFLPVFNYVQNILFDTIQKYDRNHSLRIVITSTKNNLYQAEILNTSPNSIFMTPGESVLPASSSMSVCTIEIGLDEDGYSEIKYYRVLEIKPNDKKIFEFSCLGNEMEMILAIIYKEKYVIKMPNGFFVKRLQYKKARKLNAYKIK